MTSQSSQIPESRDKSIWRQNNKAKRILTPLVVLYAVTMFPLNALRVLLLFFFRRLDKFLLQSDLWPSWIFRVNQLVS